jgi:hypothetical protein
MAFSLFLSNLCDPSTRRTRPLPASPPVEGVSFSRADTLALSLGRVSFLPRQDELQSPAGGGLLGMGHQS